jgi:hypothetical protein
LIEPFKIDGRPAVKLSAEDKARIESGQLWTRSWEVDGIGHGIGIQDIAAPPDVIFGQVADLKGYVGKVPSLRNLNVYSSGKGVDKATYNVRVVPGYNLEYYLEHHVSKPDNTVIFFLDYSRYSDLDDMMGKWYLEEHPTKSGWTRVYYQCSIKPFAYVPSFVKSFVTKSGLVTAVGWVKCESELRAPKLTHEPTATRGAAEPAPERRIGSWRLVVGAVSLSAAGVIGRGRTPSFPDGSGIGVLRKTRVCVG